MNMLGAALTDKTSVQKQAANLVALSDHQPLSWLYAAIYELAAQMIVQQVKKISVVRGVYLTSSASVGQEFHGVSDLDLFFVLDESARHNEVVLEKMKQALQGCRRLFPFVGPLEERINGIAYSDPLGVADRPELRYRATTPMFRKLFESPGFSLNTDSTSKHWDLLHEFLLQWRLVACKLWHHTDNLYFWKARLRSMLTMLDQSSDLTQIAHLVSLNAEEANTLRQVSRLHNYRLLHNRSAALCGHAYAMFSKLANAVILHHGFADLPATAFDAQIYECRPLLARTLILSANGIEPTTKLAEVPEVGQASQSKPGTGQRQPSLQEHQPIRTLFSGPNYTGDLREDLVLADLENCTYAEVMNVFQYLQAHCPHAQIVVRLPGCVATFDNGDLLTSTAFNAPLGFPVTAPNHRLPMPAAFLSEQRAKASSIVSECLAMLAEICHGQIPEATTERTSTSRYRIAFDDDMRVIDHLIACVRARELLLTPTTLFYDNAGTVSWLQLRFPEHGEFLSALSAYYQACANNSSATTGKDQLPSNFFGYLYEFFRFVLGDAPAPRVEDLHKRLTLSVAIVTRNRPRLLGELLNSLCLQDRSADEIVIVDNSTDDKTHKVVQSFGDRLPLRYIRTAQAALGKLRNIAASACTGEIVCFTDDDCITGKRWLANIERSFLRSPSIGAVGGIVKHNASAIDSALSLFHYHYADGGNQC